MASIGQLIRAVAQASGLDEASVKISARYLRQAGLIEQRSTGAGAARMTSADAAALLIAVNAAGLLKDSVEAVRVYGALPLSYIAPCGASDSALKNLYNTYVANRLLREALASTVEMYRDETPLYFSVEFQRPTAQVFFRLYEAKNDIDDLGNTIVSSLYAPEEPKSDHDTDRYVKTVFGHKTMKIVAAALNS